MAQLSYTLQGKYEYLLPELPDEKDILYWDLPKEEQYWRRENFDFEKINIDWTDEQKDLFVKRETRRRINGLYFYNNGELTYITGSHYLFLQYFLVPVPQEEGTDYHSAEFQAWTQLVWSFAESGMMYPQFRQYQKEFFYFLDYVAKNSDSEGGAISKPRRVGITACFNGDVLNLSMLKPQRKFSLMNKDRTDAIEVNYNPIKYNIEHFPSVKLSNGREILRPKIAKLHLTSTLFASPNSDKKDELNTSISIKATVENANDGTGTYRLIRDETSKYPPEIDISNMLFVLKPVAKVGTRQVGKIFFFGTSAEKDTKNFEHWKKIYADADITIGNLGRTINGLYNYFVSGKYAIEGAVKNSEGIKTELFDRYGYCKEDLAIEWIENEIRPYRLNGDLEKVQAIRRQYPIEETDPFESTTQTICYDNFRLNIQIHEVERKKKNVLAGTEKEFVTKGNLTWDKVNGTILTDKQTYFEQTEYGHWNFYTLPDERWRNKNNVDRYRYLCPDEMSPYILACDPIDYRNMIKGGSKPAIVIGSVIDSSLPNGGQIIHATYCHRPQTPNEVLEEVRKALIFFSAKGVIENNKPWVAKDLIDGRDDQYNNRTKYGKFLLTWDKVLKKFRQWRIGEEIAGMFTGTGSVEAYIRDTAIYLREPKNENEIDYLKLILDIELLKQLTRFTPLDTTKFDLAMAFSLYCMVIKNYGVTKQTSNGISDRQIMQSWYGIKDQTKQDRFKKDRVY